MIAINEQVREASFRKIQEQILDAAICMITTHALEWSLKQETLHNQWMDNDGNIWLILHQEDQDTWLYSYERMEVFYSNIRRSQFLSLTGVARLWDKEPLPATIDQWLKKGEASGDNLRYVRFTPREAFYWDDRVKSIEPLPLPEETYNATTISSS